MKNFPTRKRILKKRKLKELGEEKGLIKEDLSKLEVKLRKRIKLT